MKYSFIVPIYNVGKYLSKCIDSILGQAITDFECILVDDGSPDECPRICDEYAQKDSRIKVVHKENGGLSSARNAGLDIAEGEYICFVDSDDYITEDYLSVIDAKLSATDADMLCFGLYVVNENGTINSRSICNEAESNLTDEAVQFDYISNTLLICREGWNVGVNVFKRSVIVENGLRFCDNEIYFHDLYFIFLYVLHCKKIIRTCDFLYFDRKKCNAANVIAVDSFFCLSEKIFSYIKENGYKYFEERYYAVFCRIISMCGQNFPFKVMLTQFSKAKKRKNIRNYLKKIVFNRKKTKMLLGEDFSIREQGVYFAYMCCTYNKCLGGAISFILRALHKLLRLTKKTLVACTYIPRRFYGKNIYLIGTEDFDNMGDQLIAVTEIQFLKDNYPGYNVIELEASRYFDEIGALAFGVKKKDLIFLTGGGNMGDLYPIPPRVRMDTISRFPNNHICIFPQTIFFDDINNAKTAKEKYRKAKRLTIVSREKRSFEINKEIFDNANNILTPDIVFYNDLQSDEPREDIIRFCLRIDKERTMTDEELKRLQNSLSHFKVELFDMSMPFCVSVSQRDEYLAKMLKNYTTARLIITDRLHGMIVSTVTGTPCIVLNSKSHKLRESYEWIKDLKYVKFANSVDEVPLLVDELLSLSPEDCRYSNERFKEYYQQIVESMK